MDDTPDIQVNLGEAIRRRMPASLAVASVLILIALLLAMALPSLYKSRAVILIEAQEMPQDLVRSLVTSFADERIQVISQRVLTNSNLSSIMEKYDLYADERKREPMEKVLEDMRKDVAVTPISAEVADPKLGRSMQATIAFELSYESKSPALAQRVANEIVSLFLSENLRQRTETSKESLTFLTSEAEKYRTQVAELEGKLATFKQGNIDQLPEMVAMNLEMMNRTESDKRSIESQLRSLEQQRVYLESELAQQNPTNGLFSQTGERILGPADRVKILEAEFAPLSARYGPNHPDVIAKRKEIESLRMQAGSAGTASESILKLKDAKATLTVLKEKYSADHPDVKRAIREVVALEQQVAIQNVDRLPEPVSERPDNPAYIQLQARLQGTISEQQGLRSQLGELIAKQSDLERRMASAPEVERQYRALTRDYESAQAKYREVTAKRQEAELASNLETEQKGERFSLIEPPVVPEKPAKPNRVAIGIVGTILALAVAVAVGYVLEALDDRVHGRAGILRTLGVPPLAVIPSIETDGSLRQKMRRRLMILTAMVAALVVALVTIHLLFRPLDVLFFQLMRRFGL
jgi:succinoglycan biosynthesis transport protein ExoP